jgi:hypothetical protein
MKNTNEEGGKNSSSSVLREITKDEYIKNVINDVKLNYNNVRQMAKS